MSALAEPSFDSHHAWVEWETWYSQQEIEPLAGFNDWKLRLYRSYLPPVGGLLDCEPTDFDMQGIRWGNCDRSFLAALNAPDFVPGDAVDAGGDGEGQADAGDDTPERYLDDDHLVFGFEIDGTPYAVPRWVLFPHELLNAEFDGVPVALTYCTLCNAPILYDRRVGDGDVRTFGSTGMLASGNKVMYDEETETLWDQHAGTLIGGEILAEEPDLFLDQFAVTQTAWSDWKDEYPNTLALDIETDYGYDYSHYDGNIDFFEHYWNREEIVQPGVRQEEDRLPEKESVYGITGSDPDEVWVVSIDDLRERDGGVVAAEIDGRTVVALLDATDDAAVYEAPPTPVERVEDDEGIAIVDADGTRWQVSRNELRSEAGTRDRIPGRHGLWFAFRTHYDTAHVVS